MLGWFLLYIKMNHSCTHVCSLPFGPSPLSDHHRALKRVPYTVQYVLTSHLLNA